MDEKLKEKTKDIIRLSIPYTGANLLQAVSEQVTIVLLGKANSNTLAAYGLFTLLDPINLLFNAPLTALPAIIGTLHGENDRQSIATSLQQGWGAGLILCIPQAILLCYAKPLLKLLGQPNHLIKIAESSFYFSIITLPTTSLLLTSTSYAYGVNKTLAIFSLSILNLLSNKRVAMLTKNFGRHAPEICSHHATIIRPRPSCVRRALIPNGIHARVSHNDLTA